MMISANSSSNSSNNRVYDIRMTRTQLILDARLVGRDLLHLRLDPRCVVLRLLQLTPRLLRRHLRLATDVLRLLPLEVDLRRHACVPRHIDRYPPSLTVPCRDSPCLTFTHSGIVRVPSCVPSRTTHDVTRRHMPHHTRLLEQITHYMPLHRNRYIAPARADRAPCCWPRSSRKRRPSQRVSRPRPYSSRPPATS